MKSKVCAAVEFNEHILYDSFAEGEFLFLISQQHHVSFLSTHSILTHTHTEAVFAH